MHSPAGCNIRCLYRERRICANLTMHHPAWTRRLLSATEAVDLVRRLVHSRPGQTYVVGLAGPGEPLANAETFDALERVHAEFPAPMKCVRRMPEPLARSR